jgi:hypothetical protein
MISSIKDDQQRREASNSRKAPALGDTNNPFGGLSGFDRAPLLFGNGCSHHPNGPTNKAA